ncbi:MAG: hypothetical protein AAFW66_08585, partial [Pseudomonadota bacterium]
VSQLRTQSGRASAVNLCNNWLNRNSGSDRDTLLSSGGSFTVYAAYWVGASAKWQMWQRSGAAFHEAVERVWDAKPLYIPVTLECKPLGPSPATAPYSVDLQVTPQGDTCPRNVEVRAFIRYRGPATAKFRYKVDGILSELHEIRARELPVNEDADAYEFLVERIKNYSLSAGEHTFQINVRGGHRSEIKTINIDCPDFQVWSTHLRHDMIENGKCPRKVWQTTTFRTNGPGQILFDIKRTDGQTTYRGVARAELFDNQYKAVVQRLLDLGETDIDLNVVPKGFETAQSGWKNLKIECEIKNNGTSASDELSSGPTEEPDLPPSQKITGDFQYVDNSGLSQCPRKVRGVINFQLRKKENVHYSLDCNSGSHPSGVIQPKASSNGGFIAPALVSVDLKPGKNGKSKLICALKARENGIMTLKKVKARDFSCKKRNPDTDDQIGGLSSGSDNQSSGTTTQQNDKPKKTKLICNGGMVRNGKCACGSKKTPKKLGNRKFQCIAKPERTNPDKPKKAKLVCKGGKVRNGKCACGSKKTSKKIGKLKFQCVAKPERANPDKPKKAKLICKGGKIRNGKCDCGSKKTPKKIGNRKFQCVAKAVRTNPDKPKKAKLVCKGGKIKGGRCTCGKNRRLKKTGQRKFICFKPQQ